MMNVTQGRIQDKFRILGRIHFELTFLPQTTLQLQSYTTINATNNSTINSTQGATCNVDSADMTSVYIEIIPLAMNMLLLAYIMSQSNLRNQAEMYDRSELSTYWEIFADPSKVFCKPRKIMTLLVERGLILCSVAADICSRIIVPL